MLPYDGKLSIHCFLVSFSVVIIFYLASFCKTCTRYLDTDVEKYVWWSSYFVMINIYLKFFYRGFSYQVAIRSVFLGTVFAIGTHIIINAQGHWPLFGAYLCVMSFFHYSEFLAIAWCNPNTLSVDSFILNHSVEYGVAAVASWVEFFIEIFIYPGMKSYYFISLIGLILCIVGELLRKTAMITAKTNFNHIVRTEKDENHQLVTYGVYGICRHPSYVGWFYWSIGTQVLLLNPICTFAYAIASWKFFRERIENEEQALLCFFGKDYLDYQNSVGTGLPGIRGFIIDS